MGSPKVIAQWNLGTLSSFLWVCSHLGIGGWCFCSDSVPISLGKGLPGPQISLLLHSKVILPALFAHDVATPSLSLPSPAVPWTLGVGLRFSAFNVNGSCSNQFCERNHTWAIHKISGKELFGVARFWVSERLTRWRTLLQFLVRQPAEMYLASWPFSSFLRKDSIIHS